jgi:hypothetical protein
MSTQTPTQTHAERLADIRARLAALTGVAAYSAVGNCYREDIPYLLERLTVAEDAVRTCADEQECPDCWEVFYQGVAFGADRRTKAELRAEIAHLRLALDGIASDVRAKGCEACAEKESMARAALQERL